MSGSSLDGLDIAYCEWQSDRYRIIDTAVVDIPAGIRKGITAFEAMTPYELLLLDKAVGNFMAGAVNDFLSPHKQYPPDLLVSHGHTLLHHPDKGLSLQVGCGATLASLTGVDVLTDLRMQDVALGGQGAPLAAVMDTQLLGEHAYCLNLGGIANVTVNGSKGLSWDICAVNQVLNHIAAQLGLNYDEGGRIAQSGTMIDTWYQTLQRLPYYDQPPPKSLGNGWVRDRVIATIPYADHTIADLLHTYVRFVVDQIVQQVHRYSHGLFGTMLVTGGGAHNTYLMNLLASSLLKANITVVKPDDQMIDYKEAILMTYIGARYMDGLSTTIPAITGATGPVVGGALYKAPL
jgi:anhydro-N-acetylmuramic acid kinase